MAGYQKKSDPTFDLSALTGAIRYEEAGASQFTGGEIVQVAGGAGVNLLDFNELAPGTVPPLPTIVAAGAAGPAGTAKFWSGTLLVQSAATQVDAWR